MKKRYGVLLIGCGHIGYQHIEGIYDKENVTVIATIDERIDHAKDYAERFGALQYGTDYRPFLDDPRVDIVIIATYTNTHFPLTKECLEHHKHVICEKPIATSLADAREYVRLVKNADTKVTVSYILRYNSSYRKIKQLIDAGEIGELRMIRMAQSHKAGADRDHPWKRFLRLMEDCSPLVDCGVHYADVVQWFTGSPIRAVSGISAKIDDDAPIDNYQVLNMETENGCRAVYEVGWSKNISTDNTKDFIGTKGHITLTMAANRNDKVTDRDLICIYHGDGRPDRVLEFESVYKDMSAQFDNLVRMIETDCESVIPIDCVYSALRTVMTAEKAIASGTKLDPTENTD